jgi:hypothetical protein
MSISVQSTVELSLIGDGSSTSFTYSFNRLYETLLGDGGLITAPNTLPTSATIQTVTGAIPSGGNASLDSFGNLVLSFPSAWTGQGYCYVNLEFNSGMLSGVTAAWTSATAVNTTAELTLNGATNVLVTGVNSGTITAGTAIFQVSLDNINWFGVLGVQSTGVQTIGGWGLANTNLPVIFNVAGYNYFRILLSIAITGTGTANFIVQVAAFPSTNFVVAGLAATYNTSAPSPGNASVAPVQIDGYGNVFVNNLRRSQTVPVTGNIASATAATLCAAQGAGIFADLATLVLSLREGATANVFFGVNVSDGTKTYRFNFMSQDVTTFQPGAPLVVSFDPPLPATTANTAWTIALTSATDTPSVDYVGAFVKQQAE